MEQLLDITKDALFDFFAQPEPGKTLEMFGAKLTHLNGANGEHLVEWQRADRGTTEVYEFPSW